MRTRQNGFTLIELLVVVSIIALLISILLPAFSKFRVMSKRTACMANLHSVGQGMEAYLSVNNDYWPLASHMLSVETDPNMRPISEVMKSEIRSVTKVFQCPADRITADPNNLGKTYFEIEKTSYEWDITGTFNGVKRGKDAISVSGALPPSHIPLMQDWECFHGGEDTTKSVVIMYADLSVRPDDTLVEKR
jgi:prepilin-type N-terminal cleavage/methylation domain-containing protein